MSQSDYLKHKKNGTILKDSLSTMPSVLNPRDYLNFKQHNLVNTMTNTKTTFNKLKPENITNRVFDIERTTTNCTEFACTQTHLRPNRKPLTAIQGSCFPIMKAPGRSVPTYYNGSTLKKPERNNCVECLKTPLKRACNC